MMIPIKKMMLGFFVSGFGLLACQQQAAVVPDNKP